MSKKGFIILIAFSWAFWYFLAAEWSLFFQLQKGLFFYAIGAFHWMHLEKINKGKWKLVLLFWFTWIIGGFLQYGIARLGAMESLTGKQIIIGEVLPLLETGVVVPICAISSFILFESMQIKSSRIINTIAGTVFGVYLIHDAVIGRNLLWYEIVKADTVLYQLEFFPLLTIGVVIAVFAVCSVIDYLRSIFVEPIMVNKCRQRTEKIKHLLFNA